MTADSSSPVQGDWVSRAELLMAIRNYTAGQRDWQLGRAMFSDLSQIIESLAAPVSGQGHDELTKEWLDGVCAKIEDEGAGGNLVSPDFYWGLQIGYESLRDAIMELYSGAAPVLGGDK